MRRAARFLVLLLSGLALLAWLTHSVLTRTVQAWFERDLDLRSTAVVAAAQQSLVAGLADRSRLAATLADMTRDGRIMGAAVCSPEGVLLAATEAYPKEYSCTSLIERLQTSEHTVLRHDRSWSAAQELASGRVYLSVIQLGSAPAPLADIALVHDLSYLSRRQETTRNFLLIAFFVLSLAASAVTLLAARFAQRSWLRQLQRALSGEGSKEFQPVVRYVRSLVERRAREREAEAPSGPWSAARLKAALTQHLQGERVVILANREPYIHERTDNGIEVLHPASGLVTALEPVMRACSGVWVAHGSGSADRDTVDAHDRIRVPPGEKSYELRRVWLSEEEENGYYYGFSNEGLWPLCHVAHARPLFRTADWEHYVQVNKKFAEAVCEEVDAEDPIILVQDYHFALVPKMIRDRLPKATIITFWHIPWPNAERIGICPWGEQLIAGLLGSSILGFHTQQHCNNFIDSVDAFMESRIDRENHAVIQGQSKTLVRPYPISIEWPVRWLASMASVPECRASVRRELGLSPDVLLGVGVDRLDYTKGIEERLSAVDELLTRHPELRGRFTFIQLAAPSRTKIAHYRDLNDRVEALALQINARWSNGVYRPIVLLRTHHEPPQIFRYFRAADLCYVSSLHDGMNLVAKEFVAARDDEQGVLILSQFTGAARDLTEALVVNPYDLSQASDAFAAALAMPSSEQRDRMQAMRRTVSEFNVYRWAGHMLVDAAQLRQRERMTGRYVTTVPTVHVEGV
jgi:trehalose 6-phosphate synthase